MENNTRGSLYEQIEAASSAKELGKLHSGISERLQGGLPIGETADGNRRINDIQDAFMVRAITLAESQMSDRGLGRPPVPYAFLLFGSGGRKEQTLWSDQDNGLVYANPHKSLESETDSYFAEFGAEISRGLEEAGFAPCDGKVLCDNPLWRKSLNGWREQLGEWFGSPVWESVRYLLIAADMRMLHGDSGLFRELQELFFGPIERDRSLLKPMLENTLHRKVALGVFGQLIKERYGEEAGGVEIKYGAYIPMVNAIRLLSIRSGIREAHSSVERIASLQRSGQIPHELAEDWLHAFTIALKLRALAPANGVLPPEALSAERKVEIKFCLHTGKALQNYVKKRIQDEIGT